MTKVEAQEFAAYEVYEATTDGNHHTICVCKEGSMADLICRTLATQDPHGDSYFYTNIVIPHTFVPGGGWYVCYSRDKDGNLVRHTLS